MTELMHLNQVHEGDCDTAVLVTHGVRCIPYEPKQHSN